MEHYNVLLVDDVLINRKIIKVALRELPGIVFHDAADGVNALTIVKNKAIDLVILDLVMPVKDGFEVLEELKRDGRHKDIPVIIYSALSAEEDLDRAMQLGAYDYFVKPLSAEQMRTVLPARVWEAISNKVQASDDKKKKLARVIDNELQESAEKKWERKTIGYATPAEWDEIQRVLARKKELKQLFRRLLDMDREELYSHLSEMIARELGQVSDQYKIWWADKYELYHWDKIEGDEIELDYVNGEIFMKKIKG